MVLLRLCNGSGIALVTFCQGCGMVLVVVLVRPRNGVGEVFVRML